MTALGADTKQSSVLSTIALTAAIVSSCGIMLYRATSQGKQSEKKPSSSDDSVSTGSSSIASENCHEYEVEAEPSTMFSSFGNNSKGSRVLLTGGAGYIGSHVLLELLQNDCQVIVLDNLVNSSEQSIERVASLAKEEESENSNIVFCKVDLRDREGLEHVFIEHGPIDSVIHCAGLKAVSESKHIPLEYYENNLTGTINLLQVMEKYKTFKFIFSSSATVYGTAPTPYSESSTTGQGITNPYGQTKYMIEQMLKDLVNIPAGKNSAPWEIVILRYFNPIGAHPSGLIGEDPQGIPNNLMPFVSQVCIGKREQLTIYGDDYPTRDGTCIRDYIHVMDLAKGHVAVMQVFSSTKEKSMCKIYNLGSGKGISVKELVDAMEETVGKPIPQVIGSRREGDLPEFYAVPERAHKELHWGTKLTLKDMCEDTWRWQQANPHGYDK